MALTPCDVSLTQVNPAHNIRIRIRMEGDGFANLEGVSSELVASALNEPYFDEGRDKPLILLQGSGSSLSPCTNWKGVTAEASQRNLRDDSCG